MPFVRTLPARLGVAAAAVTCLTVAATPLSAGAATLPATTTTATGLFAPDWGGSAGSRADAQWQAAAMNNSVLVGIGSTYGRRIAQLHAWNPNLVVLAYNLGPYVARSSATFTQLQSQHPDWFAHDSQGRLVNLPMFPNNYLMDMGNAGYRAWGAQQVLSQINQWGFDGAMIDSIGDGPTGNYASGKPVNPATNVPYTAQQYLQNAVLYLNTVKAAIGGKYLMFNGLRTARDYAAASNILATSNADGGMAEMFLRTQNQALSQFPKATDVQQALAMMSDMQAHGKAFFGWTKAWASGTQQQLSAWDTYATAVYLLGRQGSAYFNFDPARSADRTVIYSSVEQAQLGQPLGPYTLTGTVYSRSFEHGTVTLDTSTNIASIQVAA